MNMDSTRSLKEIFEQALLAQASYSDLTEIEFSNKADLVQRLQDKATGEPNMTDEAAKYFADRFGVVHQLPNTTSGYSGTIFRRRDASLGGFTFAQRGTEFSWTSRDLWDADLIGILIKGGPYEQRRDMDHYWDGLLRGDFALSGATAADLAAQPVDVTGHSLGGNLATWFIYDRQLSANQVYTYNGAGVAYISRLVLGGAENRISNLTADAYLDFIEKIPGTHYGSEDEIFIEALDGSNAPGHALGNLLTGIASTYLLSMIDPTLDLETVNGILDVSSNEIPQTFEEFAAALGQIFARPEDPSAQNGHAVIFNLISALEDNAPAGHIFSIRDMESSAVLQQALAATADGSAMRFALVHGLPFAVSGSLADAARPTEYDANASDFSIDYLNDRISTCSVASRQMAPTPDSMHSCRAMLPTSIARAAQRSPTS